MTRKTTCPWWSGAVSDRPPGDPISDSSTPPDVGGADVVDLLVVGGGIVGTWAAYVALRAHESWRVVLVEGSLIGSGATRFSLGFSLPLGRTERQRQMAAESGGAYRQLARDIGGLPMHFVPVQFVVPRSGLADLERSLIGNRGLRLDGHDRAALAARIPGLHVADDEVVVGGVSGWYSAPAEVAVALARQVGAHSGGTVWEGAAVEEITLGTDVVRAHLTDGRHVLARRAIIATGPMLVDGLVGAAARIRGIRVKKIVALHLDQCPQP